MDINKLLQSMSLREKVFQLIQISSDFIVKDKIESYNPSVDISISKEDVYLAGSFLGTSRSIESRKLIDEYLKMNPHKIPPLIFADVIHGFKTIFPIPLAFSFSFNPYLSLLVARISSLEASYSGIHGTYSPMIDVTKDPRWGRVMETFGEDSYVISKFSREMIKGYEKNNLKEKDAILSCLKHYIGYGKPEGGRDYNTSDMSHVTLYNEYLVPYINSIKLSPSLVMTSFNTIDRIPLTINKFLVKDLLQKKLKYKGVIVTDYNAISETITHGNAESNLEASLKAFEAGIDIDMASGSYSLLEEHVLSGKIKLSDLDERVLKILKLKDDLGLFENPYKNNNSLLENDKTILEKHFKIALKVSLESIVLLKNEEKTLPLKQNAKISLLGMYQKSLDFNGAWSYKQDINDNISLYDTISKFTNNIYTLDDELFNTNLIDIDKIKESDYVVLTLGERRSETGEAKSKTNISLKKEQIEYFDYLREINENIIVIIYAGRPLDLSYISKYAKAILLTMFLGSTHSTSTSMTLFGKNNPSGKLTISFPRNVGQIPLSYNSLNTGRPAFDIINKEYVSNYQDEFNSPLYPFTFGLSYTNFIITNISLDNNVISKNKSINIKVSVLNSGTFVGKETIFIFLSHGSSLISQPTLKLIKFEKKNIKVGERKDFIFKITREDLFYYNILFKKVYENKEYVLNIGSNINSLEKYKIKGENIS
ncbi:MAG: glycoside hydrolase family 3 C-terminal domain-containing protein [Acholeplasmatales bacterium]|jgi:beta-glucosidase|nr:glycoside hydrolase family 3 C-terminal domain-containing protein [Acholeplasmatales bacterium]